MAHEIMSYGLALQGEREISFLEPAIGTGSFYSALLSECRKQPHIIKSATGIEMDKDFYAAAYELWSDTGINLINEDFTEAKCLDKVNFLISNPPYIRHHYIDQDKKINLLQ